jgi:hypothetical protein
MRGFTPSALIYLKCLRKINIPERASYDPRHVCARAKYSSFILHLIRSRISEFQHLFELVEVLVLVLKSL